MEKYTQEYYQKYCTDCKKISEGPDYLIWEDSTPEMRKEIRAKRVKVLATVCIPCVKTACKKGHSSRFRNCS